MDDWIPNPGDDVHCAGRIWTVWALAPGTLRYWITDSDGFTRTAALDELTPATVSVDQDALFGEA